MSSANASSSESEGGECEDSLREQLPSFDGDLDAAKRLRMEGKATLDHQLKTLQDIDSKASAILRVNILLLGLLLTAISVAGEDGTLSVAALGNAYSILGLVFLFVSTALAALTYTASDTEVGIDTETILEAIDEDLTDRDVEVGMAEGYAYWIAFNNRTNAVNSFLISLTSMSVVVSLAHFFLGVHSAVGVWPTWPIFLALWVVLYAWMDVAGLKQQAVRAIGVSTGE